jgi:putative transposase
MLTALVVLLRSIGLICRGHRAVAFENLALRQQVAALTRSVRRPQLRARDRLFWIVLAKGWREWRTALIVVQPDTVVRWHRQRLRSQWTRRSTRTRLGRQNTDAAVRTLVGTMAAANPLWRAPRIHGELCKLGITVSERTVSRLLRRPRRPRSQTWRTFLTNHVAMFVSMDFFTVPTLTQPRAVRIGPTHPPAPTNHPCQHHGTSHRGVDGATDHLSGGQGASMAAARSRQSVCGETDRIHPAQVSGPRDRPRRAASATSFERVSHLLSWGAKTHLALEKDTPTTRRVQTPKEGRVVAFPEVGGLHHRYERRAA